METLKIALNIIILVIPASAALALLFVEKELNKRQDKEFEEKISALSIEKDAALKKLHERNQQLESLTLLNGELDSEVRIGGFRFFFKNEVPKENLSDFHAIVEVEALGHRYMMRPAPFKMVIGNAQPSLALATCYEPCSEKYEFKDWHSGHIPYDLIKFFSCDVMFSLRNPPSVSLKQFHQSYIRLMVAARYVDLFDHFDLVLNNWVITDIDAKTIRWRVPSAQELPIDTNLNDWRIMEITRWDDSRYPGAIIDLFNGKARRLRNLRD